MRVSKRVVFEIFFYFIVSSDSFSLGKRKNFGHTIKSYATGCLISVKIIFLIEICRVLQLLFLILSTQCKRWFHILNITRQQDQSDDAFNYFVQMLSRFCTATILLLHNRNQVTQKVIINF